MKQQRIDWPKWDHLLGVETDIAVAEKIGCFPPSVWYRRTTLDIPASKGCRNVEWSKWDHLLGVESDPEIAGKVGCTQSSVFYRRKKLGIEKRRPPAIDWTQWDRFLGKETDRKAAKRIGCSWISVFKRRHKLGIQPGKKARIDWSKWDHLVGSKHDKEVAEVIGCDMFAVISRRNKLGIPKPHMKRWKKLSCPVVVVAPAPAENTPEMREALKGLDPRTRDVIARRYGLETNPETLEEIGEGYDLTRERIRQLEKKGLQRLRFLLTRAKIQNSS